ncbi:LytTR family DNA-binding domain-containing protein [Herminiimonas sp. CN]|uniref:LytR/AlgR family response regulator transcription factor n=1 Tax=Herminiimonas sp. CN TaxID=1349818 RepID=UPI000472FF6A|nr:response regulator [Herminiimonas sp. CN]
MISAIVVEDSDVMRTIWRELVAAIADLSLAGEYRRVSSAIAAIRHQPPNVILLDIQLNDGNGMDVMRMVANECPVTKVIVVSNYADPIYRSHFAAAGAYAFYDKSRELAAVRSSLAHLAECGSTIISSECIF